MADVIIEGIPEIFAQMGAAVAISTLLPPMRRSTFRLEQGMKKYPSPRAGSSYKRTRRLGNAWTTEVKEDANGLVGVVGNNVQSSTGVPYGPFVQSQMFQAAQHRGRWQTDKDVAEKETPAIVADFDIAIQAVLR